MLGSEAPCDDSPAVVVAVTRGLDAFSRSCADGSTTPVSYWLDDASPMELDVTDAASVQAVLDRVADSTDGQVTSMMLVENGEAKMPDGSPRTYSDLQLGVPDPQTVLDVRVHAPGAISGKLRASEDSSDLLQISEIDVNGLLECSVELRSRTGATGATSMWPRATAAARSSTSGVRSASRASTPPTPTASRSSPRSPES